MLTVIVEYTDNTSEQNARIIIPKDSENSSALYKEILKTCATGTAKSEANGTDRDQEVFIIAANNNLISAEELSKKLSKAIENLELKREFQFAFRTRPSASIFSIDVNGKDMVVGFPKALISEARVDTLCGAISDNRDFSIYKFTDTPNIVKKGDYIYATFTAQGTPIENEKLFKRTMASFLTEKNNTYTAHNEDASQRIAAQQGAPKQEESRQENKGSFLRRLKPW